MYALQVMDRYWKEIIQVSTLKNDIKVQYLYDMTNLSAKCELQDACIKKEYNAMKILGWKTQLVRAVGWVEKPFYDMGD